MKRVKLKSLKELEALGFEVYPACAPKSFGNLYTIVSPSGVAVQLDLDRSHDLLIVPRNSLNEETFAYLESAFEVIE